MTADLKNDRSYSRKEVKVILASVLEKMEATSTDEATVKLYGELKKLEAHIESMRSELAQLRSIEISHNHIPAASDELDAVVEETAQATGSIMDACEKISEVNEKKAEGECKEIVSQAITSIYEACSFQDITGQRISKVVKTLKNIEQKVHDIIEAIGPAVDGCPRPQVKKDESKSLLNGPQLKGGGATQEEIDAILASFG